MRWGCCLRRLIALGYCCAVKNLAVQINKKEPERVRIEHGGHKAVRAFSKQRRDVRIILSAGFFLQLVGE